MSLDPNARPDAARPAARSDSMVCPAPNAKLRAMVLPQGPEEAIGESELAPTESGCEHGRPARISLARLLKRGL